MKLLFTYFVVLFGGYGVGDALLSEPDSMMHSMEPDTMKEQVASSMSESPKEASMSPQNHSCPSGYLLHVGILAGYPTCPGTALPGWCILPRDEAKSFCDKTKDCDGVSETSNKPWFKQGKGLQGMVQAGKSPIEAANLEWETCFKAPEPAHPPVPAKCRLLKMEEFQGQKVTVKQASTLHGPKSIYTYNILIGEEIRQSTSTGGKYLVGKHASYGKMTETFTNGNKCGSVARSATVTYTFGPELKLLKASEPSKCIYEYEIQLTEKECVQASRKAGR